MAFRIHNMIQHRRLTGPSITLCRPAAARRGTILIMVCALLVLLAIMGVAWLSTTRIDRYASAQHNTNTQIDLLLDGVIRMTQGAVASDVYGRSSTDLSNVQYRPRNTGTATYGYTHVDSDAKPVPLPAAGSVMADCDRFLGSRWPQNLSGGIYSWPAISSVLGKGAYYESPLNGTTLAASNRYDVAIGSMTLDGRPVPALTAGGVTLMAADTDGDGIADAFYWPLPAADISGVRYYAAVRIIDNCAAVNASVAWKFNDDVGSYSGFGAVSNTLPADFFPVNIDLASLLSAGELSSLNTWRFGGNAAQSPTPWSDAGAARGDFVFQSPYEALWTQLGRRASLCGFNGSATVRYRALSGNDEGALACRFVLGSSTGGSTIESVATASLTPPRTYAYNANEVATWYSQNFNYPTAYSRRSMLVARSTVSNHIPVVTAVEPLPIMATAHSEMLTYTPAASYRGTWGSSTAYAAGDFVRYGPNGTMYICLAANTNVDPTLAGASACWEYQPWTRYPAKCSANTGTFRELFRAYWSVMCGDNNTLQTPFGATEDLNPYVTANHVGNVQRMFRSSLREVRYDDLPTPAFDANTVRLPPFQQLLLRSALGSVNAIDLRDSDDDITSRRIVLKAWVNNVETPVEVMVYGQERSVFITEVYANTDNRLTAGKTNPKGYVAVELHNPTDKAITLTNWRLAVVDRRRPSAGGPYPRARVVSLTPVATVWPGPTPASVPTIPAGGYLLLENYNPSITPGANDATYRPASAGTVANSVFVPNLHEVLEDPASATLKGGELVLLRPRRFDGTLTSSTSPFDTFNENNIQDLVPADQFDFTGLKLPASATAFTVHHYVRPSGAGNLWKFVWPGRYNGCAIQQRHEGTQQSDWDTNVGQTEPALTVAAALGAVDAIGSYPNPYPPIPLAGREILGANPVTGGSNRFPYGGFARNGDMLAVPFIGAYRLRELTGTGALLNGGDVVLELSAAPIDAAMADDNDPATDAVEQIGRPCPLDDTNAAWTHYNFASDFFDYLTVLAPHDDFLPNTDPRKYTAGTVPPVYQTVSSASVQDQSGEDVVGVEGLINLNTAPWPVIARLPLVGPGASVTANGLAQEIVNYRKANGPFRSLFELNRVTGFRDAWGNPANDPDDAQGDIAPPGAGADGMRGDFKERYLSLNRISNMVTLRSDSFTCYVLVQGWRGAGTSAPQLAAERRWACTIDRTGVYSPTRFLKTSAVPTE